MGLGSPARTCHMAPVGPTIKTGTLLFLWADGTPSPQVSNDGMQYRLGGAPLGPRTAEQTPASDDTDPHRTKNRDGVTRYEQLSFPKSGPLGPPGLHSNPLHLGGRDVLTGLPLARRKDVPGLQQSGLYIGYLKGG